MTKYTDEQTKKALECCAKGCECNDCPVGKPTADCLTELPKYALDLINRQEAEIERYKKEHKENFDKWDRLAERTKNHYEELYQEAKAIVRAEAIKEFWDEVKKQSFNGVDCATNADVVFVSDGEDVLEEMVGESKCT